MTKELVVIYNKNKLDQDKRTLNPFSHLGVTITLEPTDVNDIEYPCDSCVNQLLFFSKKFHFSDYIEPFMLGQVHDQYALTIFSVPEKKFDYVIKHMQHSVYFFKLNDQLTPSGLEMKNKDCNICDVFKTTLDFAKSLYSSR